MVHVCPIWYDYRAVARENVVGDFEIIEIAFYCLHETGYFSALLIRLTLPVH